MYGVQGLYPDFIGICRLKAFVGILQVDVGCSWKYVKIEGRNRVYIGVAVGMCRCSSGPHR